MKIDNRDETIGKFVLEPNGPMRVWTHAGEAIFHVATLIGHAEYRDAQTGKMLREPVFDHPVPGAWFWDGNMTFPEPGEGSDK